jgi:hypothetical protein
MSTNTEQMAYVGIAPCGCMRAAVVDEPKHAKDVRKDVSGFMRDGLTVERVPVALVRVRLCLDKHPKVGCPHEHACPHAKKEVTP